MSSPFDPLVEEWFRERLGRPTEPQVQGWPLIREGGDVLISAPTGSGKTLAAFLICLDALVREAVGRTPLSARGAPAPQTLPDEIRELSEQRAVKPVHIRTNVCRPMAQAPTHAGDYTRLASGAHAGSLIHHPHRRVEHGLSPGTM